MHTCTYSILHVHVHVNVNYEAVCINASVRIHAASMWSWGPTVHVHDLKYITPNTPAM